jgi:hypothetical protein
MSLTKSSSRPSQDTWIGGSRAHLANEKLARSYAGLRRLPWKSSSGVGEVHNQRLPLAAGLQAELSVKSFSCSFGLSPALEEHHRAAPGLAIAPFQHVQVPDRPEGREQRP